MAQNFRHSGAHRRRSLLSLLSAQRHHSFVITPMLRRVAPEAPLLEDGLGACSGCYIHNMILT